MTYVIMWNPFKKITYQSSINGTITIGNRNDEKALYSGGVTQSGGEIAPMWDEVIKKIYCHLPKGVCDLQFISGSKLKRTKIQKEILKRVQDDMGKHILILGVGGGSVINAIRKYDTTTKITGIELDPMMKQVALEQFEIKENAKQKIVIADAIAWLQKQSRISRLVYDTIIVDLYIGPLNPPKSREKTFLLQLKKLLKQNGTILYNAHYQKKNSGEYEAFREIIDKTFKNVDEVFSYPLNRVLLLQ
ncbi:MAG: hypothetical protein KBD46_01375 [Candidatus Levybacteria bacterium]|nr:hypothetical protein [Candidatus Levybacteria bacterium]